MNYHFEIFKSDLEMFVVRFSRHAIEEKVTRILTPRPTTRISAADRGSLASNLRALGLRVEFDPQALNLYSPSGRFRTTCEIWKLDPADPKKADCAVIGESRQSAADRDVPSVGRHHSLADALDKTGAPHELRAQAWKNYLEWEGRRDG